MRFKKEKKQINWLQLIIIFILGILIAANIFLFFSLQLDRGQINKLSSEIDRLKADDIAIAQVINNLITQLQANRIIQPPADNNP